MSFLAWKFKTRRFRIELRIYRISECEWAGRKYDGDDPDGQIIAELRSGALRAFDSELIVELDGIEVASDWLCESIYRDGEEHEFWTAHRDPDPMWRNSSIMRAANGNNVAICHYFPGMVKETIRQARTYVRHITANEVLARLSGPFGNFAMEDQK